MRAAQPLTEATTETGRRRAAAAVLGRLGVGRKQHAEPRALHRLLAELSEPVGRQLLVYVIAIREPLLAALAADVLYPYFVHHQTPVGLTTEEFRAFNANGLFEVAGAITHTAVAAYARRQHGITYASVTRRALRLLRKGGILASAWMARGRRRCLGYFPILGCPDLACFAYALYVVHAEGDRVRLDQLRAGVFSKLFLLRPIAIDFLLEQAREAGLLQHARPGMVRLCRGSLEEATEALMDRRPDGETIRE